MVCRKNGRDGGNVAEQPNGGRPPLHPEERMIGRSISGPPSLWEEAETIAAAQGVTVSWIVRELLRRYVKRHGKTRH